MCPFYERPGGVAARMRGMPERVITLAISDAEWKALRAVQPEPIDWLKRTIRNAIDQGSPRTDAAPERPAVKAAGAGAQA
jgi:hypothetical protein